MVTLKRLIAIFALGCLLCSLAPTCASGNDGLRDDGVPEAFFSIDRHILQYQEPCNISWQYVSNFTILEEACPYVNNSDIGETYPKKHCCDDGLGALLCPYLAQVNDRNSQCAQSFWATLSLVAPNYTQDFFQLICTDVNSPLGIECPNGSLASPPGDPSGSFAPRQGSYSSGVTLLLAIAVLEMLILLF